MIGTHYNALTFNCAHFVAEWYREKLDIHIDVVNEFDISFIRWMRLNFTQTPKPVDNCLVYMQSNGSSHIGIYSDYGVYHNYQNGKAKGSVVHWDLGTINRNYKKVTYWKWLK